VINRLANEGQISKQIETYDSDFPIIQYADDTLLIMPADKSQIIALREELNKFSMSTGLKINYSKSQMVPINVPQDVMVDLAAEFGCQVGTMPFTYLGLPLVTTKPKIIDLMPLACRMERRLASSSSFLSQGARLQLINSALASMPLHFLTTLQLPVGFTGQLDRILRQCLWRDKDTPKPSLAAWEMVCKPKKAGGLGVVNFQKQNAALLIKHLDKFYNHAEVPWVYLIWNAHYVNKVPHAENVVGSFWWKDIIKLVDNFRGVARVKLGKGDTFLFWQDNWQLNGEHLPLQSRYPRLFSFAINPHISAKHAYECDDIVTLFHLPLSQRAFEELGEVQSLLLGNPVSLQEDVWVYSWGDKYTSANFYQHIHKHLSVPPVFKWIWKSSCIMKTKTFAWLLLSDRLNTRDLLQRRHWHVSDDTHCVLCPLRSYEDRIHLFFQCNFSCRIWNYL
jgi:hypothetical protein